MNQISILLFYILLPLFYKKRAITKPVFISLYVDEYTNLRFEKYKQIKLIIGKIDILKHSFLSFIKIAIKPDTIIKTEENENQGASEIIAKYQNLSELLMIIL